MALENHGSAKFHVDVKEGGGGAVLNFLWMLSGELVNMLMFPRVRVRLSFHLKVKNLFAL